MKESLFRHRRLRDASSEIRISKRSYLAITLPVGGGSDDVLPIFIAEAQTVSCFVYCMHRLKDLFGPDPGDFRPDRWEENLSTGWRLSAVQWRSEEMA